MRAFYFASVLVALAAPASAQDTDGRDHALLPRYADAAIVGYRASSLEEIVVPTGPIANESGAANRQVIEGQVTHIDYRVKPATAPLQIERYYEGVLRDAGFAPVYSCLGPACGRDMGSLILNSGKVAPTGLADGLFNDKVRVLVSRRGDTWVLLHVAEGPDRSQVYQAVVEGGAPAAD
ncbi:DUF4892 domain-containing protein [Phenylobacterium sp.]|uniref:DUF4892 domain-containing protein n=1 Tax=Phenylobacterium sp. TaxID=1871053 RepID=UPI00272FA33B|nr:DUF4892 domain-containing protein [Phenylobacterium sp.]MDP1599213.1 DUF4892 domain-containing protein [Phenylobacterium sp.]MDP3590583.1 DUF4892 domain-containing protein [Phenylobacterium sp.]